MVFSDYNDVQKIVMVRQIQKLEELFPDYQFFLNFGTLLGAVREGGLIGHDYDIDISYLSHFHTAKEVEQEMKDIYKVLMEEEMLKLYFTQDRTTEWFESTIIKRHMVPEIVKPNGQCHVIVDDVNEPLDLWTTWIDEEGNYFGSPIELEPYGKADDVLPLIKGRLYDIPFNIPNNWPKILEHHYGDWKTPRDERPKAKYDSALKVWLEK